jgi:hypothetical protein
MPETTQTTNGRTGPTTATTAPYRLMQHVLVALMQGETGSGPEAMIADAVRWLARVEYFPRRSTYCTKTASIRFRRANSRAFHLVHP